MSSESPEETTLEVLDLPPGVDEELLTLYFENKRRSGGGPLVSVEKKGNARILVFEEAEAAARVLSRGHHVLQNVELSVRKPACKDKCRLLLRGVSPNTITEMVELFVENMMGLNLPDYTLHPVPGRDCILIHLSQPFSKDFQTLTTKISKRTLDGAKVTLEQIEQADSVLVENLRPGTTPDLLTLYFESRGGGGQTVKDAMMLSEGTAKVSFVNPDSVSLVLDHPHKLEGVDLVVRPYFDFLQPAQTPQDSRCGSHDMTDSEGLSDVQTSPTDVDANNTSSSHLTLDAHAVPSLETSQEVAGDQLDDKDALSEHIAITDPVKLSLFQLGTFQQETENSHTNVTIQIKDNGLHVAATDRQTFERIKQSILEYFGQMAKTDFTLEPEEAEFLKRKDVKERLEQSLNHTPAVYTVLDSDVVVTAPSQKSANQACSFLKLQLGRFSIPVDSQHESMLHCREWSEFLQALSFSSVKVSERGENIDVLTLKGMESEKQAAILEFLSAPIERETVISMEPGMLKYIQTHCHQLLADMTEVSIFPLESDDVCGLKLHGPAVACQMAEEVIQGMLSSIYTKTITISAPGITRYLGEEECKKIMKEMERRFQVYIIIKHVPWEPLQDQDIFQTAWTMMSNINFPKVSVDVSAQKIKSNSVQTNHDGAACRDLLEEAKTDFSPTHHLLTEGVASTDQLCDFDNVDLYTAEEPISFTEQFFDAPEVTTSELLSLKGDFSGEIEDAQLSLAIQYSMEASQWTLEDEEEQVQKALELSMRMIQKEASSCDTDCQVGRAVLLEETIKAANTIQLVVFALYSCDIFRVDIAFSKKVNQGQVKDKLEHQSLKNMTEYHKKCLEMIKRKHGVEIQIQGTIITISGFRNFVNEALCDVKLLLEKMSNSVSDQEILGTVQWVYHDPISSNTTPYSPDAIVFIENVWKMKLEKIDILLDNQRHTINFVKMQQYNVASGTSVKISRKLLNSGDLDANIPEEYSTLLSNLPDATRVDEDSDEFQNVVQKFYETIQEYHNKIRIVQVEKLMNRLLCSQYKLKKASVLQSSTCPEVERTLYHGTSEASVKEICVHGFNRSFCGKNATVYGQGVYFAVNSALSVQNQYSPPNADGYKFIFVSKVLTGDYTKGCHSMKTAPLKESGDIPLRYDSVTDNISKPTMFVIFNDTQAVPEYLITCQRIHC